RLGEPARAMIVARRTGRPRETLPTILGTLVSQTLLNILALVVLGSAMFLSSRYFDGHEGALVLFAAAPIVVLAALLLAPALLRRPARAPALLRQARAAATQLRAGLR